jgi:hypothetical protein
MYTSAPCFQIGDLKPIGTVISSIIGHRFIDHHTFPRHLPQAQMEDELAALYSFPHPIGTGTWHRHVQVLKWESPAIPRSSSIHLGAVYAITPLSLGI